MADVKLNPVFEGMSRKIGDLAFVRQNGRTFVKRLGEWNGEATGAQKVVVYPGLLALSEVEPSPSSHSMPDGLYFGYGLLIVRLRISLDIDPLYHAIKVAFKKPVLCYPVLFKLGFGMGLRYLRAHPASILQDFPVYSFDESVEASFPILHGHGNMTQGHILRDIKIGGNKPLQLRNLFL
jgi:hypothetical protein